MNPYQNPSIELFGIRIDEPVTAGTDVIVALIGIVGFFMIHKTNDPRPLKLYVFSIFVTAIATLMSALIGHAFLYKFGMEAKLFGWCLTLLGVNLFQFAVLYHVKAMLGDKLFKVLFWLNVLEAVLAFVFVFIYRSFVAVEIHTAFGMIVMVMVLEWIFYSKSGSELSLGMIYGVALAVTAVLCQVFKLSISKWFNYMDLGHIFIAVGMIVMLRGIRLEQKNNLAKV